MVLYYRVLLFVPPQYLKEAAFMENSRELFRIAGAKLQHFWQHPIAIIRLRAKHSIKTLVRYMVIWTVLVGTVFWMEPVLIGQIIRNGHFGLGEVTFDTYISSVLAWLVPLFAYQVFGHCTDAVIAYNDRNIPADNFNKRLGAGEYRNAYDPSAPQRQARSENFDDYLPTWGVGMTAVFAGIAGFLAGVSVLASANPSQATPASITHAVLAGVTVAYIIVAVVAYLAVVTLQADYQASSMFLPWYKPWTWLYLLATLPMVAYQVMAAIRLLLARRARKLAARPSDRDQAA